MRKLSYRLQEIFNMVNLVESAQNIYDLCCDHGHLAYQLWKKTEHEKTKIFAIDCAEKVIDALESRYGDSTDHRFVIARNFGEKVTYLDKSTIIIAGVGAHTSIRIIEHILGCGLKDIDIIFCCHQNIDLLREYLNAQDRLGLIAEKLVVDQGKFYELIHVKLTSEQSGEKVSLIGDKIWQNNTESRNYHRSQSSYWQVRRDEKASFYRKEFLRLKERWES